MRLPGLCCCLPPGNGQEGEAGGGHVSGIHDTWRRGAETGWEERGGAGTIIGVVCLLRIRCYVAADVAAAAAVAGVGVGGCVGC